MRCPNCGYDLEITLQDENEDTYFAWARCTNCGMGGEVEIAKTDNRVESPHD